MSQDDDDFMVDFDNLATNMENMCNITESSSKFSTQYGTLNTRSDQTFTPFRPMYDHTEPWMSQPLTGYSYSRMTPIYNNARSRPPVRHSFYNEPLFSNYSENTLEELDYIDLTLGNEDLSLRPLFVLPPNLDSIMVRALFAPGIASRIRHFLLETRPSDNTTLQSHLVKTDRQKLATYSRLMGVDFIRLLAFGVTEGEILDRIQIEFDKLVPFFSVRLDGGTQYTLRTEILPAFIKACRREVSKVLHAHTILPSMKVSSSPKRSIGDGFVSSPSKRIRRENSFGMKRISGGVERKGSRKFPRTNKDMFLRQFSENIPSPLARMYEKDVQERLKHDFPTRETQENMKHDFLQIDDEKIEKKKKKENFLKRQNSFQSARSNSSASLNENHKVSSPSGKKRSWRQEFFNGWDSYGDQYVSSSKPSSRRNSMDQHVNASNSPGRNFIRSRRNSRSADLVQAKFKSNF